MGYQEASATVESGPCPAWAERPLPTPGISPAMPTSTAYRHRDQFCWPRCGLPKPHFLMHGTNPINGVRMIDTLKVIDHIDENPAANPVIPGLGHQVLLVFHYLEAAVGNDGIANPNAKDLLGFLPIGGPHVNEHILFLDYFVPIRREYGEA